MVLEVSRFHRSPRRIVALDYFLKIDGVSGESPDAKHKGEIQLESFSWGETSPGGAGHGGGGGAGKVQMQDLVVTMVVSKASPKLMLACATGKHHKEAVLTVRKAGKDQQEYYIVKLKDVVVTSYQVGGSGRGRRSDGSGSAWLLDDSDGIQAAEGGWLARCACQGGLGPQAEQGCLRRLLAGADEEAELEQPSDDGESSGGVAFAVVLRDVEVAFGRG